MGSIGDDLWQDFTIAEQETMMELQDIVQEANTYKPGWGQTIFSSAAQMLEHEKQKKLAAEMKELKEHEEKQRIQRLKREEEEEARESQRKAKEAKKAEEDLLREEEASKTKRGKSKK